MEISSFGEIIVFGSHCRQFEEGGSYFEILRRFFVIEHNRSFVMHLRIGKKYHDLVEFPRKTLTPIPDQDEVDTFVIDSKAKNLMKTRLKRQS